MIARASHGLLVLALMALSPGSRAQTPASTSRISTSVYAGLEIGTNDSRRIDAGASVQFTQPWSARADVSRAEFQMPDANAESTSLSARITRGLGSFDVSAGYSSGEIQDFSDSRAWYVGGAYRHDEWRVGLGFELRDVDLEPAAFTEDLGGEIGVVSGTSRCSVDGIGYRAAVDLDRPAWSLSGTLRFYDYDDYDCALDITASGPPENGPPLHARGRALGRRLAAGTLDQVVGAASRLVPRDSTLLESSAGISLTLPVSGQWIGSAELYRDVEELDGSEYLTAIVSAGRKFGGTWRTEFILGYSSAEIVDDTAFAGVRVTAAL